MTTRCVSELDMYTIRSLLCPLFFFFFQAEDGIRDLTVTGVQTCALPIFPGHAAPPCPAGRRARGLGACALQRGGAPAHAGPAGAAGPLAGPQRALAPGLRAGGGPPEADRKSTRLNSSHSQISYAVFCLKKKNRTGTQEQG